MRTVVRIWRLYDSISVQRIWGLRINVKYAAYNFFRNKRRAWLLFRMGENLNETGEEISCGLKVYLLLPEKLCARSVTFNATHTKQYAVRSKWKRQISSHVAKSQCQVYIHIQEFTHFSRLSYDRSMASSKASSLQCNLALPLYTFSTLAMSSGSCLRLLPLLPITSISSSIMRFRRQFLRSMWQSS
jgi:hypothetical protein